MKNSGLEIKNFRIIFYILHFAFLISAVAAQSTEQNFPTAITSNEISGQIAARDIGDPRLTNYFYIFSGNQGDVFINVQTSNFNGDIDVFTADNLKPLTKITIYADDTNNETGRVVYLRQAAKLILRIEGRTPNDDAATFRIKFAGSFEPLQASAAENAESKKPEVKSENQTGVRVNSVGTIIEVKPKPLPPPKATIAKTETKPGRRKSAAAAKREQETKEKEIAADGNQPSKSDVKETASEEKKQEISAEKPEVKDEQKPAPTVTVSDNAAKQSTLETDKANSAEETKETVLEKPAEPAKRTNSKTGARTPAKSRTIAKVVKTKEPNPLENVHLVILLKDGTRIERAMSEVIKVAVDRGVLTVIANDGTIKRYPILDVAKMTIE